MPRRSSHGGKSARPAARVHTARNPPKPVNRAPAPASVQSCRGGSLLGSIGSAIADGMAFGTGIAVAHRAVDAALGPRTIRHETVASGGAAAAPASTASSLGADACSVHSKAFQDCRRNSAANLRA